MFLATGFLDFHNTYMQKVWSIVRTKLKNTMSNEVDKAIESSKSKNLTKSGIDAVGAKKKLLRYAVMLAYQGKNYFGMQIQKDAETIESHLLHAMKTYGIISEEESKQPNKFGFQRAARTDRHVSAVRQMCSMWLPRDDVFLKDGAQLLNKHLPNDIRVIGVRRTTPSFNAQKSCDSRTYSYTLPTYAFAEVDKLTSSKYRISQERLAEVDEVLSAFVGTHNFFNYTARREYGEQSCNRYIISFKCDKPFLYRDQIRDMDVEFMSIYIRGQSFMLHQIRKMIGLTIAIIRGFVYKTDILKSFESQRLDVPKAPGLGLLLERLHYENYDCQYSKTHEPLNNWGEKVEEEIIRIRDELIIKEMLANECQIQSMMMWLTKLPSHRFMCDPEDEEGESSSDLFTLAVKSSPTNQKLIDSTEKEDAEFGDVPEKRFRKANEDDP